MVQLKMLSLLLNTQLFFGGEEPLGPAPDGEKWHHEGLTRRGSASWTEEARNELAFHADYVDSYQYNPLWWVDLANGGGIERVVVAVSTKSELLKLHFDDLFSNYDIAQMWRRYLSGTVCGLLWAANSSLPDRTKISCAHNIIGSGLHAIQDFYSHSNWIDSSARRSTTWFDADDAMRTGSELYTGYYEEAGQFGVHPHGTFEPPCAVLSGVGLARSALKLICHATSPLTKSSLCRMFRRCNSTVPVEMPVVEGVTLPRGVVYVEPGMNLDSRWQAPLGVRTRGQAMTPPLTPVKAFDTAYQLAARSSCQWLVMLERIMADAGLSAFWQQVTSTGVSTADYKKDVGPFEHMDLLPYQFLTAGSYPPPEADHKKWYVRLLIETSDIFKGDTDADIVARIDGHDLGPLDHGIKPATNALNIALGHNDFARKTKAAYMVGPLQGPPTEIELANTGLDFANTIGDAAKALGDKIGELLEDLWDAVLSIVGYHADLVKEGSFKVRAADLETLPVGTKQSFEIDCNGAGEGHYKVHGEIAPTGQDGALIDPPGIPTRRYAVTFTELECVKESSWDRGSNSDEPFIVGMVLGHGGRVSIPWRTEPFEDMDDGEKVGIGREFTVDLPPKHGFITLPIAVYESDDETAAARDEILEEFSTKLKDRAKQEEDSLLNIIGDSIAQGWHCAKVDVIAFRRGPTAEVIEYETHEVNRWIDGGDEEIFRPTEVRRHTVGVPDRDESGSCGDPFPIPEPQTIQATPNEDSTPGATAYVPTMFDQG